MLRVGGLPLVFPPMTALGQKAIQTLHELHIPGCSMFDSMPLRTLAWRHFGPEECQRDHAPSKRTWTVIDERDN